MKRTNRTLVGRVLLDIKKTLDNLGIDYDQWFYESDLMGEDGAWERMFSELDSRRATLKNATARSGSWPPSSVPKKTSSLFVATWTSTNTPTSRPILPTTSTNWDRSHLYRNFSRTINIWGGDHHGHVIRLAAAMRGRRH